MRKEIKLHDITLTFKDDNFYMKNSNKEFLEYMKNDDREEKFYEMQDAIHDDMNLLFYVYEKLEIPVIKFYEMKSIDDVVKDKYTHYELLQHLGEYFNVNDEYFYIAFAYNNYDNEEICSMDESRVHDYFIWNTNDKLYKIFMKDPEMVCNVILEYLKENY